MNTRLKSQYYSQYGEDVILAKIFKNKPIGLCVEVGANNGIELSNTYHFEQQGWRCILVEPIPELCSHINRVRTAQVYECAASDCNGSADIVIPCNADAFATIETATGALRKAMAAGHGELRKIKINTRRLDDILEEASANDIDFISIDVEGHETRVLDGFSLSRWNPKVILIENNERWENAAILERLSRNQYRRVYRTGCNDWYVRKVDKDLNSFFRFRQRGVDSWSGSVINAALIVCMPSVLIKGIVGLKRRLRRAVD